MRKFIQALLLSASLFVWSMATVWAASNCPSGYIDCDGNGVCMKPPCPKCGTGYIQCPDGSCSIKACPANITSSDALLPSVLTQLHNEGLDWDILEIIMLDNHHVKIVRLNELGKKEVVVVSSATEIPSPKQVVTLPLPAIYENVIAAGYGDIKEIKSKGDHYSVIVGQSPKTCPTDPCTLYVNKITGQVVPKPELF